MSNSPISFVQAVLGAALSVHRLGLKRNVVYVIAVAENSIDALAFKPHNIIRSHKGFVAGYCFLGCL